MHFIMENNTHKKTHTYISRLYSYGEVQNADLSDLHRSSFEAIDPLLVIVGNICVKYIYINISHTYTYNNSHSYSYSYN